MPRHELEQSVLDEYKKKFEVYFNICYLLEQSGIDNELYEQVMTKAAGVNLMIKHMEKNILLPS